MGARFRGSTRESPNRLGGIYVARVFIPLPDGKIVLIKMLLDCLRTPACDAQSCPYLVSRYVARGGRVTARPVTQMVPLGRHL